MTELTMVTLPVDDVKALLDIATNSMDFGSGFWDHEECEAARKIAVALGVDPINVTPASLAKDYPHAFKAREMQYPFMRNYPQNRETFDIYVRDLEPAATITGEWENEYQHGLYYTDHHCEKCQQLEDWPAHQENPA